LGPPNENRKLSSGKAKDMDVDAPPIHSMSIATTLEDMNQPQVMHEEPESFNLGGLDIMELKEACKKKEFEKIPEHQLNTLEVILARAYQQHQLGIQSGSYWDGNLTPRDSKKRGRRIDLQRTIALGKILVESGRYAKLTKYYKPTTNSER